MAKKFTIKERLDPGKVKGKVDSASFWNNRRNATHPQVVRSEATPKTILFKSQDAWRIQFDSF